MAAEKTGKHAYRVMIENQAQKTHRVLDVVPHAGSLGQTIYIEAQKGDLYRLAELLGDEVGYAPESLKVARVGADLHITFADDTVADLVISRYYDVIPADSLGVVGQAFDGQVYSYLQWQQVYQGNVPTLADGMDPTLVGLGGNPISEPVGNAFAGLNVDPTIAAIGLLGLLGLAGGGGGSCGGVDDAPTNESVGLAITISTDADNNALVSKAELGDATTFTSHVTVNDTAQVGGKVVIKATNGTTELTAILHELSQEEIDAGGFDVSFAKPNDGETQTVTANYVNAAGTAASDAVASDSAKLDTTEPGKNPNGSNGDTPKPIVNIAEAADGGINATEAANGIQTQVTLPTGTVAGDTVTLSVLGGNGAPVLDAEGNAITVDYTVTANDIANKVAEVTIPARTLGDGSYQVSAVVTDQAGNSSQSSETTDFTLDTSGATNIDPNDPSAGPKPDPNAADSVTVSVTSISEDTGTLSNDFITSDNTLVISGGTPGFSTAGAASGDKVLVKITDASGNVVASALVDPDATSGEWTFDATQTTLDDGVYALNASIVDAAGNVVKAGDDQALVIDTSGSNNPDPAVDPEGNPVNPTDPNADPNAAESVTVGVTSISEDTGTAADDFITSDNTLVISGGTTGFSTAGAANGDKVLVKITDANGDVVASALVDPDATSGEWTFDATQTEIDDGVYTLNASIVDAAGNVVKAGGDQRLEIDTSGPTQGENGLSFPTINEGPIYEDSGENTFDLLAATDIGSDHTGYSLNITRLLVVNEDVSLADNATQIEEVGIIDGTTLKLDTSSAYFQDLAQDETRTISLEYVVKDAAGNINEANHTADITVTGVNDAPVLDLDSKTDGSGFAIYNWNGSETSIISESISISDIDNATLSSLSVSFATVNGTTFDSNGVASNQSIGDGSITYIFNVNGGFTPNELTKILQGLKFSSENPTTKTEIVITVSDGIDSTSATTTLHTTSAPSVQQLNDSADIIQSDNAPLSFAPLATSAQMDLFSESPVADPVDSPASSDANTADALAQVVTDLAKAAAEALGADSAATLDAALASDIGSVDWNAVLTPEVVDQVDEALSALDQLDLSAFTLDPALSSLLDHWGSSADTAAVLTSLAADDALRQLIDQQLSTVALGAVV